METGVGRDFIDGILTDRQPMMDIEFTEDVLGIILAMYQASDTRSWAAPFGVWLTALGCYGFAMR